MTKATGHGLRDLLDVLSTATGKVDCAGGHRCSCRHAWTLCIPDHPDERQATEIVKVQRRNAGPGAEWTSMLIGLLRRSRTGGWLVGCAVRYGAHVGDCCSVTQAAAALISGESEFNATGARPHEGSNAKLTGLSRIVRTIFTSTVIPQQRHVPTCWRSHGSTSGVLLFAGIRNA